MESREVSTKEGCYAGLMAQHRLDMHAHHISRRIQWSGVSSRAAGHGNGAQTTHDLDDTNEAWLSMFPGRLCVKSLTGSGRLCNARE